MAGFFTEIKQHFKHGNALKRFIIVNAVAFVIVILFQNIGKLFSIGSLDFSDYLVLPSLPILVLQEPWTLITYMFMHHDMFHILFNMLWLYWFGGLFLQLFTEKQLVALYFFGGLAGAFTFILVYNTLPFFTASAQVGTLQGASAAVLAIVCATAFRIPDFSVRLFLLGDIKLKYIAAATILIDLLSITSANSGGHFAHLGGAVMGYIFVASYKHGKDITKGFNRIMDFVVSLVKPATKPKLTVKYKKAETDMDFRVRKNQENKQLDAILDKLKKSGYDSLTAEEKKYLFDASKK